MSKEVEKEVEQPNGPPVKDGFPRIVLIIILTEFCERFSFSGMRAFLTLYLRSKLGFSDDAATEMYHIFSFFIYFFPVLGGIIADNWLGRYRTILYLLFVYAAGNFLVAITAIPQLALPPRLCTMFGLLLITVGTGGIKPCVAAFGGDQFKLPDQEKHLTVYFSILYFSLCVGSLIAKTVSPILRSEIHCFGDKDCYSVAFGAPGIVVLISIVIFVSARKRYVTKKPEGNTVGAFVKCILLGVKNKILKRNRSEKHTHWLDSTQNKFDKRFIADVKKTLDILTLFTTLPVFWALLDQMGSRWTLQATKMDGRFGFITVKPDQLQGISPIWILLVIPFTQKYVYPYFERRNLLTTPLQKQTLGSLLAVVAFLMSALVEIYLKTTYPQLPQPGLSQLRLFNGNSCPISIQNETFIHTIPPLSAYMDKNYPVSGTKTISFTITGSCVAEGQKMFALEENSAVSYYLYGGEVHRFLDKVDKSKAGFPIVRFLSSPHKSNNLTLYNERRNEVEMSVNKRVTSQTEVFTSTYSLRSSRDVIRSGVDLKMGGVYTIVVDTSNGTYDSKVITITEPNSITMAWLLPQFLIMATGEVFFAIPGNEFAFKEAPDSMKAVMTAMWLLTEAGGNVIIIIITRLFVNYTQETQSFIYTGMMVVSVAIFQYLSRGYKFDVTKKECRSNSEVLYLHVKQTEDCLEH